VEKGQSSDRAEQALAAFAEAITRPETRRLFENNEVSLEDMIKEQGADAGDLPDNVRSFLNDLSSEEMRLLSTLHATLVEGGFADPAQSAYTLAKF
jgi:hypothetical protein